jgi:uncharacterized membrane protein
MLRGDGFCCFQAEVCYAYKFTIFDVRECVAMGVSHAAYADYTYTNHVGSPFLLLLAISRWLLVNY